MTEKFPTLALDALDTHPSTTRRLSPIHLSKTVNNEEIAMFELVFAVCTLGSTPINTLPDGRCWVAQDQPLFKTEANCREQSEKLTQHLKNVQFPIQVDYVCVPRSTT